VFLTFHVFTFHAFPLDPFGFARGSQQSYIEYVRHRNDRTGPQGSAGGAA